MAGFLDNLGQQGPLTNLMADKFGYTAKEPDIQDTYKTVMGVAHTLLDLPEDQRKMIYPKAVEFINQKDPKLGQALMQAPMPTTEDLLQITGRQPQEAPQAPTFKAGANLMRGLTEQLPPAQPDGNQVTGGIRGDAAQPSDGILDAYTAPIGMAANAVASLVSPDANAMSARAMEQKAELERIKAQIKTDSKYQEGLQLNLGKNDAKRINTFMEEAQDSIETIAGYQRAYDLIKQNPDAFGPGATVKSLIRTVGQSVDNITGLNLADENKLAAYNLMKNISVDPVLKEVKNLRPASDTDIKLLQKSTVNSDNPASANLAIIYAKQQLARWKMKRAQFYDQWMNTPGHDGIKGADEAWTAWNEKHKLQLVERSPQDKWLADAKAAYPEYSESELLRMAKENNIDLNNYKSPYEE